MAKNEDIIPSGDAEFDILQRVLVAAVLANAAGWNIPTIEITKLTDKQTIWDAAWAIAQDKQNSTTAQKRPKTWRAMLTKNGCARLFKNGCTATRIWMPQMWKNAV